MRRTKIVATLGPASEDKTVIRKMMEAGLNVVRLNCSHGSYEQYKKIVHNVRVLEKETGKSVSILMDLQGPKIRFGNLKDDKLLVHRGDLLTLSTKDEKNSLYVPYSPLPRIVKKGQLLLIDDGQVRTKIVSIKGHRIKIQVLNAGIIRSKKGINVPEAKLERSQFLGTKDLKDLEFGLKTLKVDAVAVSFVETAEEMQQVRKAIQKWTKRSVQLIAKIERPKALKNLEAITESADALMVARGDLAIETEPEMVPLYQRKIINLARKMGKPVIVATQMLQSMVESPVATRAEISDAATAIFESADAFMLSNESAVGTYPVQAVRTLARVARATEQALLKEHPYLEGKVETEDERLALNACVLAHQLNAKGILLVTEAGFTAKTVLKYRPSATVFSFTSSADIAKALNFLWGANEIRLSKETEPETLLQILKKNKEVQSGDKIVFIQLKDKRSQLVILEV